jgi:acylphosphatase
MADLSCLHAVVYGHVQGVYFRAFVFEKAANLGLTGYTRNLAGEEAVEVWAEGYKGKLEELLAFIKTGPPRARVDKVSTEWQVYTGKWEGFKIDYSGDKSQ